MHEKIRKSLAKNAKHIHAWWDYTGRPDVGEDGILESLKRLVSGVLTHPVTIGKCVAQVSLFQIMGVSTGVAKGPPFMEQQKLVYFSQSHNHGMSQFFS